MVKSEPVVSPQEDATIAQPQAAVDDSQPQVPYGFFKAALIAVPAGFVLWLVIFFAISRILAAFR
jgi:hypothetical protein